MTKRVILRLHTAIPISMVTDPEFGLAALLRIEAQLAAWHRYGHAATVRLAAIRLRWQPTVPPAPESLLRLVTDWAVRRAPSAAAGQWSPHAAALHALPWSARATGGAITAVKPRYAAILPNLRAVARAHGYALALHGSAVRDLDLIAVPWTEPAADADVLVEALRAAVNGVIHQDMHAQIGDWTRRNPQYKAHGRLAWSIHLDAQTSDYIDLSVLPLRPATGDPAG